MDDQIGDVLEKKGPHVWSLEATDRVGDAAELMVEKHIGSVVVLDEGRLTGLVDERDVIVQLTVRGNRPWNTRVGELVRGRELLTVRPDHGVHEAVALMTESRRRHLPVCVGDELVGLVSLGDLGAWLGDEIPAEVSLPQSEAHRDLEDRSYTG